MSRLTNALDHAAFVSTAPRRKVPALYGRSALAVAVALAIAATFAVANDAAAVRAVEIAGPELTRLLRFMAVLKGVCAAGAVAMVWWRSGYPATPRVTMSYVVASFLMAAAPGLIWSMAHVALGAVLFHAGLALLLVVCWTDRASTENLLVGLGRQRARRRPKLPPINAA